MEKTDMVGLARIVLYRRERILMLEPRGKGMVATTLHYKNEVRNADAYFEDIPDIKIPADMLDLAVHIVETKKGHFDPDKFEDRYEQALADLITSKRSGKAPPQAPSPRPSNVVNLMDALRRSVQAERRQPERAPHGRAAAKSKGRAAPKRRRLKKAG
jgi:DNA end-binding protein Ku